MRKRKIVVQDYDPTWPKTFDRLYATIWPTLSDVATAIEHVGSTSVPGLSAKPIIDMAIVISSTSQMPVLIERLATINYIHNGDQGVPGREAFRRPQDTPAHNLYACAKDNLGLRNQLTLRNYLRQNPEAVQAYGDLKKQLAIQFPHDIDAYIDGKTELILDLLKKAGFTPEELQAIRDVNTLS
jgi:GrpB-like predicted nucleotidyltransferase (UPF0157 family)